MGQPNAFSISAAVARYRYGGGAARFVNILQSPFTRCWDNQPSIRYADWLGDLTHFPTFSFAFSNVISSSSVSSVPYLLPNLCPDGPNQVPLPE
jgi:hypothetical protein